MEAATAAAAATAAPAAKRVSRQEKKNTRKKNKKKHTSQAGDSAHLAGAANGAFHDEDLKKEEKEVTNVCAPIFGRLRGTHTPMRPCRTWNTWLRIH